MNALKEALRLAEPVATEDSLSRRREALAAALTSAKKERDELFPVEAAARSVFDQRIHDLEQEAIALERECEVAATCGGFKKLSLEPLRWRHESGYPKLAVFRLSNPDFRIKDSGIHGFLPDFHYGDLPDNFPLFLGAIIGGFIGIFLSYTGLIGMAVLFASALAGLAVGWLIKILVENYRRHREEKVKARWLANATALERYEPIRNCYHDVVRLLQGICRRENLRQVSLEARFHGLIPSAVRERIRAVQGHFQDILLVAEPKCWSLEKVAQPKRDPLVCGWDGANLWLIADFDITDTEEYVKREFTS